MVNGLENPYRTDRVADDLFVGRDDLLAEIAKAVQERRNALRAVMGGRGMGKTSFAKQLETRLGSSAQTIVASGEARRVASVIGQALHVDLIAGNTVDALIMAATKHSSGCVAIVLDEVEKLLGNPEGRGLLDNLREAYDGARGRIAVLVLGGTEVRDLLLDNASPFFRRAGGIHTLSGLSRDEAATLIRRPLNLDVPDDVVDSLWTETAGHPWLLQMFMELAVQRAASHSEIIAQLPAAIRVAEARLHSVAFPLWWDNLRERGREVYRRLVRRGSSVPRGEWVESFGDDPRPWLDVLSSTGLAVLAEDAVLARGTLFRGWVEQNHPAAPSLPSTDTDRLGAWLTTLCIDPFESLVVRALAAYARATVEFPAAVVKQGSTAKGDNSALQPEIFFQIIATLALLQHERDLFAEPEALSMGIQTRSDVKVRSLHDRTRRACVEFKIFGRNDAQVVEQVIKYAAPEDTFAAVVSVDRCQRPLRPAYEAKCFQNAPWEATYSAPSGVLQPAFFTVHTRPTCASLRVWHFLVQLSNA